ncbi:hypothetical protein B0H11DRAFT_2283867 [Mycena galericulata]|nr:hypothetical protein B0H11DRAFT_2283867 [Mycena galericulata]
MPFPQTFDAYLPSNTAQLFALAKFNPAYVPLDTLRAVPLEPAHTASFEYAKKITPPEGFLHSVRCYYFALALLHSGFPSATPGVPQITFEELNRRIYHTCILHDLGWTTTAEGRAHPAHAMTFELHGGIMAYEHLHAAAPALDAQQVGDIVQSIVLHTSDWLSGKVSATKLLMSLSAIFDVAGYDAYGPGSFDSFISRKTVQEIEKAYPRGNFAAEGEEVLQREVAEKPDCLLTHFPGGLDAFLKIVRKDSIVPLPPTRLTRLFNTLLKPKHIRHILIRPHEHHTPCTARVHPVSRIRVAPAIEVRGLVAEDLVVRGVPEFAYALSAAAYFVLGGYDTYGPGSLDFLMHRKTVQEIETAYPHGNLATEGAEVLTREGVTKPDCLLSHWPGGIEGLFKMVLKANRIVGQ